MSHEERFRRKVTLVSTVCSVLVVLLHSFAFNDGAQATAAYHIEFFLSRCVAQAAVPVFFALSAFLFYRGFSLEKLLLKWRSRLRGLVIPYLIWNFVSMIAFWFLAKLPFINTPEFPLNGQTLLGGVVFYQYNLNFWFMYNLIVFTYLAPAVYLLVKNRYVGIAAILSFVLLYSSGVQIWRLIEIRAVIYYLLGAWCGIHLERQIVEGRFHWTGIAALLGAVGIIYSPLDGVLLGYILARLLLIYAVYRLSDLAAGVTVPRFLLCSFPIYAMHNLILETFNKLFSFVLPVGSNWILLDYFGSTVMTIAIICVFNALLLKYVPRVHRLVFGGRGGA